MVSNTLHKIRIIYHTSNVLYILGIQILDLYNLAIYYVYRYFQVLYYEISYFLCCFIKQYILLVNWFSESVGCIRLSAHCIYIYLIHICTRITALVYIMTCGAYRPVTRSYWWFCYVFALYPYWIWCTTTFCLCSHFPVPLFLQSCR